MQYRYCAVQIKKNSAQIIFECAAGQLFDILVYIY